MSSRCKGRSIAQQGRSGAAAKPSAPTSLRKKMVLTRPIDLSRPTDPDRAKADRLNAALREFDVGAQCGAGSRDRVRRSIGCRSARGDRSPKSSKRKHKSRPAPTRSRISSPTAPNAFRVGVNGACAYNTVQEGINAATNGQTVRVAGDFFAENIDISGKNITIEGGYNATCTAIVTGTISRIDAACQQQHHRCDAAAAS